MTRRPWLSGQQAQEGVYADVPAEQYHAGPQISASGLKRLLPPYTPAHYRYGEFQTSAALDFGKVAHRLVLGDGDSFTVSPFESFRTAEAKAWKAEQEAAGLVVISADDHARAQAMAKAVTEHPWAGRLFTDGKPEQSLYWTDPETGVACRARYDWLRTIREGRRLIIPDYKSARSANPLVFAKASADFGYYISAAFYVRAAKVLGLDPDPAFVLVAQEKTPPYLVTVAEFSADDMELGEALVRKGLRIYADCLERDVWPGYAEHVVTLDLPTWHRIQTEEWIEA